jgi:predicted ATPase
LLATSRRPLMLAGEREFPVPPLPLARSVDTADEAAAVQMFLSHARMVRPGFTLTDSNRADVVALCRRLDGLPLALELAAANLRLLTPHALLSRIDGRLGLGLTAADRPSRQRTLGATIDWSYDLLDEFDRTVFRRLGVFCGSADLDAVNAVAGMDGVDTFDALARLVSASLVGVDEGADGEPRIRLLETIRTFAAERLAESGEADTVRLAHLRHYLDVVTEVADMLGGPRHTMASDRMRAVESDVRAALDWALQPSDDDRVEIGHRLLVRVTGYWYRFGNPTEARTLLERGIALADDADSEDHFNLLHQLGIAVVQHAEEAAAIALFERARDVARRLGDRDLEARAVNSLAIAIWQSGDPISALPMLLQSLELARAIGNRKREATALSNLVVIYVSLGRYDEAVQAGEKSMAANTANGDSWGVAIDRVNYTGAVLHAGDAVAAHRHWVDWAAGIVAFEDQELIVELLELGACICAALGDAPAAARMVGSGAAVRRAVSLPRPVEQQNLLDRWLIPAQKSISAVRWDAAYAEGGQLPAAEAIATMRAVRATEPA